MSSTHVSVRVRGDEGGNQFRLKFDQSFVTNLLESLVQVRQADPAALSAAEAETEASLKDE